MFRRWDSEPEPVNGVFCLPPPQPLPRGREKLLRTLSHPVSGHLLIDILAGLGSCASSGNGAVAGSGLLRGQRNGRNVKIPLDFVSGVLRNASAKSVALGVGCGWGGVEVEGGWGVVATRL